MPWGADLDNACHHGNDSLLRVVVEGNPGGVDTSSAGGTSGVAMLRCGGGIGSPEPALELAGSRGGAALTLVGSGGGALVELEGRSGGNPALSMNG